MKTPVVKDIVLVGAGHAHVEVLRRFGMNPIAGVRFTLLTREVDTPYSGMLPGLIAGHYTFDQAHIDAGPLARFADARLYRNEAIGLDLVNRTVLCRDRPPVPYDVLCFDIGSRPNTTDVAGAAEHAIPVKPIDGFIAKFEAMMARVAGRRFNARICLVGAGAGGIELMLAIEYRLRNEAVKAGQESTGLSFTLLAGAAGLLPAFPSSVSARLRRILGERGITIQAGANVTRVEPGRLHCADGLSLECDEILWTTQAAAADWLKDTGLALDARGFLRVDALLRCEGHPDIFAVGDTAAFGPRELPKSGVYAVRAGPVLARNIRACLTGANLEPYKPQRNTLSLISTGGLHAVGSRNGVSFEGEWVWCLKDWIDRRFMDRFNAPPPMRNAVAFEGSPLVDKQALQDVSAHAMRCGGCGAKVGASILSGALGAITPLHRDDVIIGLHAPDDAAIVDMGGDKLAVQSVDFFRAMVDDPYLFGKIAANHALGDIFAMGGAARSALAIVTLPYGLKRQVETDLLQMMQGANEVLIEADCALVGGHTGEGAELALGFAINGLVARDAILRKSGMRSGDVLVLTKPVGTGALLAADRRGKAKARWVMAAINHMLVSNRAAAGVLGRYQVSAATDVTGFGLLGHLVEMTRASGVEATLYLDRVALLDGARESVAAGFFSSLQPENLRLRDVIRDVEGFSGHYAYPLIFDPQTAGGLLASVPASQAQACVSALRVAGYASARVIGLVTQSLGEPEFITLMDRVGHGVMEDI